MTTEFKSVQSTIENENNDLRICSVKCNVNGTIGLHLTRAPWDPYPSVIGVQSGSNADDAGVKIGDCILAVNGENILGKRITEIADKIRNKWHTINENNTNCSYDVTFLLWNSKTEQDNINRQSLQKFATCLQNITQLLECPICLEIVRPPVWQCCHGHILCDNCRKNSVRCPICRVTFGPRGRCLLADKIYTLLNDTFPCSAKNQHKINAKVCNNLEMENSKSKQPIQNFTKKSLNFKNYLTSELNSDKSFNNKYNQRHHHHQQHQQHQGYYCPSGKLCNDKMKNQHELFIHLQNVHKMSVTQYYCAMGEKVNIKFNDKSVIAIAIQNKNTTISYEMFFVIKMKYSNFLINNNNNNNNQNQNDGDICWLWYLGEERNTNHFKIMLECNNNNNNYTNINKNSMLPKLQWLGQPISLECSLNDVLKSAKYAPFNYNFNNIYIEIKQIRS